MDSQILSTRVFDDRDAFDVWAEWFRPVFDVSPGDSSRASFQAEYRVWTFGNLNLTWASAPATRTLRTIKHIRRVPIDHWVISYSGEGPTAVSTRGQDLNARAGVPFVWSLGQPSDSRRTAANRLQLYLPRDSFSGIGSALDMSVGSMLDTGPGQLLADYMLLLERNLPNLTPDDATRLPNAIQAMVAACLAPSADRSAHASSQIKLTLLEKVRQTVSKNLRSPLLGPDKLCREAAMSRSQLYRLLEAEGGVTRYIQRRRLSDAFATLSDVSNTETIGQIADGLCFSDPSSFCRAFRSEFGMSPGDVRASALSGHPPAASQQKSAAHKSRNFLDCLQSF